MNNEASNRDEISGPPISHDAKYEPISSQMPVGFGVEQMYQPMPATTSEEIDAAHTYQPMDAVSTPQTQQATATDSHQNASQPGANYTQMQLQAPVNSAEQARLRLSAPARVSVVIVARNYGRFLSECLHSILSQTVKPAEIVYADDGSEDDSVRIAEGFQQQGVTILQFPHLGVVESRNRAVSETTGDFLLHVDGDNILAPDFIERQIKSLSTGCRLCLLFQTVLRFARRRLAAAGLESRPIVDGELRRYFDSGSPRVV